MQSDSDDEQDNMPLNDYLSILLTEGTAEAAQPNFDLPGPITGLGYHYLHQRNNAIDFEAFLRDANDDSFFTADDGMEDESIEEQKSPDELEDIFEPRPPRLDNDTLSAEVAGILLSMRTQSDPHKRRRTKP